MIKAIDVHADLLRCLVDELWAASDNTGKGEDFDGRWLAIGRTHLQEGMSALRRAVIRPIEF